ncbi:hypothetical protein, partial [Zavarzinella formosa]|uniref:hypothetical protein n=1 Tax=Zavarzinella formosa TaxID=360055 RepID=UPI00138AE01D
MQSRYPRGRPLTDDVAAGLLGLDGLRVGSHGRDGPAEFWVQSVWRARVLPAFDADAYLVAIAAVEPWPPAASLRTGLMERGRR